MAGGEDAAHVLAISVGSADERGFAVVVEEDLPGTALPIRGEGRMRLDVEALRACATAREYGLALGAALLSGSTLAAWQRARARGRERLHVVLAIEAPELRTLRWERLCAPFGEAWDFVRCDQRTPFTLRVASESDREYAPPEEPRALLLVTSPDDLADYGLAAFDTLATLAGTRAAVAPWPVDVLAFGVPDAAGPPTLEGLCAQLTARRYAVVHVVCHGAVVASSGETVLYLADEDESTAATPASKLLRRLGRLGGDVGLPLLWFLCACASAAPEAEGALGGLAVRLGRELGAPAVVAMSERVSIDTANALAGPFYRQLRAHGHVDLALAEACSQVAERADLVVPVLHARAAGAPLFPGTGPSGHVVKDMSKPPDAPVFSELPAPLSLGERFVGRAAVMAELERRFAAAGERASALALVGAGGLGKTRVALELLWRQRERFPGGVYWLDVSAPARREAGHHALLKKLRPDAPPLAELQAQGVVVAGLLAEAARAHRPGGAQLWILDHLPEPEAGQEPPAMAELCPRWGEVAVLLTSRMRPADPELEVIELEALGDAAGAALLTAGLPAGSMAEADAIATARWVGGLPIALELLARSLDLGDLSPTELRGLVEGGSLTRALDETHAVLRAAGAAAGLSPIVESLRISYTRLSPAAQGLARRLAQFGPEPLPTALVKALGEPASRLARATLAARSFVTGISGERFGVMHRVLADFLRGLCGAEEPAEATAALLGMLPLLELEDPQAWPRLNAIAAHAEALLRRASAGTRPEIELGQRLGVLYHQQQRHREAEPVLRRVHALAEANLPETDRLRLAIAGCLAQVASGLGSLAEARALQTVTLARCAAAFGADDRLTLTARSNLAVSLQLLGEAEAAHAEHAQVAEQALRQYGPRHTMTLNAWLALAASEMQRGALAAARALQERALAGWRELAGPEHPAALDASVALAQIQQLQGDLPAARATITATLAAAGRVWSADSPAVLRMREALAAIQRDLGETAAARAGFAGVREARGRTLGPGSQQALIAQVALAQIDLATGEYASARALLEEVLALGQARLGVASPLLLLALTLLVDALLALDELERARGLLEAALAQLRPIFGPQRPELLGLEQRLADLLGLLGELPAARALQARVLATWEALAGPRHPSALGAAASLAMIDARGGDVAAARALQERVLKDSREVFGAHALATLTAARQLAASLRQQGELARAHALQIEALRGLSAALGDQPEVELVRAELADTLVAMDRLDEAEAALLPAIEALTRQLAADHRALLTLRGEAVRLRVRQRRPAEAEALRASLWPQLQAKYGPHSLDVAALGLRLGQAHVEVGAHAEAVPLLQAALEPLERLAPASAESVVCAMQLATALVRSRGEPAVARAVLTRAAERVRQHGGAEHPLLTTLAEHGVNLGLIAS